jgi:hypothetical protein
LAAVAAVAGLIVTTPAWSMQSSGRPTAQPLPPPAVGQAAATPSASSDPVAGRAWVGADRVELRTRLWLAIENREDEDITSVTFVDFDLPGFSQAGECWTSNARTAWPSCLAGSSRPSSGPWTVAAHSSIVLWADMTRSSVDSGRFVVSGVFEWSDKKGRHQSQLQTAPLEVTGISWKHRPLGFSPEWLEFAKDLFLPLTLVGVGFFLQRLQQKRTDRQAVWATMLAKSHTNAERHYMPIESAILTFEGSIDDLRTRAAALAPDDFDEATLWLLLLLKRNRILHKKIGGVYFKNRIGEFIATECWNIVYFQTVRPMIGRALLDQVVEPIDAFESLSALNEKRAQPAFAAVYEDVRSHLMTWSGFDPATRNLQWNASGLKFDILFLRLWSIVLEVEMNRPEKLWYEAEWTVTSEPPLSEQLDQVWSEIEQLVAVRQAALAPPKRATIEKLGNALAAYKDQF